jgi:hypothetical protein
LVERLDVVVVDATQDVSEPSQRVDVVELGSLYRRVHHGGAFAAAIGTGEQPRLRPSAMQRSWRSAALLVRQMRPSERKRANASQRLSM